MKLDAERVVEIAREFLIRSGYPYSRVERFAPDEEARQWHVRLDVGLLSSLNRDVTIDDDTGKVVAFV